METYTVKKGDTLYGISNQYGTSVSSIKKLNNLTSNTLSIGQVLKISDTSGTNPDSTVSYTVKKGDSLYSIARVYATTVNELIKLNNLNSNVLSIGQVLLIPDNYSTNSKDEVPSYINYTVKKGDSLYSIGKEYNLDVNTIIKDNALSNNLLSIGQNLKLRVTDEEIEECYGTDSTIEYIVKKGDTLYSIASKYNTTANELKNKNNLKSNTLSIGQILKI